MSIRITFLKITLISFCVTAFEAVIPASDLQLHNLQGGPERLSNYKDHIVVLNFWATNCAPCRKEMPFFQKLHTQYVNQGVRFIAASIDHPSTKDQVQRFVRRYLVTFPVWIGATAEHQAGFRLATAVPATVILDRDGIPVFRIIGEAHEEILVERLEWLLSPRTTPTPAELVLPPDITPEHFHEHELGLEDEHEEEGNESEVPS